MFKRYKLSDQSLAWLTSNVPLIFHSFLLLFYYETIPTDHTNNCNRTYIISSHFSWLFCNVCQKKLPASAEPEECTWLLATNTHILLVRDSDVIWLQKATKAIKKKKGNKGEDWTDMSSLPLHLQFLTLATIVFFSVYL